MHVLILDGSDEAGGAGACLAAHTTALGAEASRFALSGLCLAPCLGDFECWTRTPGLCRTRDPAQEIARAMHGADLIVFLTPVVFGGYGAELKKAVDRLIGLVQPHFHDRDGLTRHLPRYGRYAPILCIGLAEHDDDPAASTFRELAAGNAINLLAPALHTRLVNPAAPGWQDRLREALDAALAGGPGETPPPVAADALATACAADPETWGDTPPRRAAILIGSARPKGQSTSESLARPLLEGLAAAEVPTTLVYASQFIKTGRQSEAGLAAMLEADLLVVAAPLYVDGLPYLVTRALEQLAARIRVEPGTLTRVAGLLNCGYPEAVHNRIGMGLLRNFARQGGLAWVGGLALGGGEIIHGRPLASSPWLLRHPRRALAEAAAALARGQPIPATASARMARPLVPPRLFRWLARLRWIWQARKHGISPRQLLARPHDEARAPG